MPPFTTIRGAGPDKTIINSIGEQIAFQTVNETSTPGAYANDASSTTLNQARNLSISGLTIKTPNTALSLVSCKDSVFKDIILNGSYNLGDPVIGTSDAIRMDSLSTAVSSNNNVFDNVVIENFVTGIKSNNDIKNNTWTNCEFNTLWQGFSFGLETILGTSGMLTGPINNNIIDSKFDNIYQHAIQVKNGTDNTSNGNKFYNVGNAGGSSLLAAHAIINFNDIRNTSVGDWFQRSEELGYDETYKNGVVYHPEVKSSSITTFETTHTLTIGQSGEFSKLFRLPAETNKAYEIDYIYRSSVVSATRTGTMSLVVDPENNTYNFSDDYNYTGDSIYAENLKFTAQNYDENGDTVVDTVAIMMLNLTSSDNATLYYKVKTKS